MQLDFRSFVGTTFRPQSEALINEELGLFSIITPWGPQFQVKQVSETLTQNYETLSSDQEITSIYKNLSSLSHGENILRRSVLLSNEQIHKSQNRGKDYSIGYELICGAQEGNHVFFVQVGHPAIYLDREGEALQPLGHVLDFSGGLSKLPKRLPPLPSQLFGIYSDIHCSVFSAPLVSKDRLLFISRAFVPNQILNVKRKERTLDHLSLLLSEEDRTMPFWLGILDFSL